MDKIIRESFIARLWAVLAVAFHESIPGKIIAAFKRSYACSKTRRVVLAFLLASPHTVESKFYNLFYRFNKFLAGIGNRLHIISQTSVIMGALRRFSASKFVGQSVVLSSIKKFGMRKLLIAVFALYLPVDWIVRDVLAISSLASIWDEAFLAFCVVYIIFDIASSKKAIKPRISPVDMPLLLFMAVGILCVAAVSPRLGIAIAGYRAVCQFMLWFFVLTRLIKDDEDFKVLYFTICGMAVLIALHGIYQYITKAPMPETWVARAEAGVRTRVYSIFGSPNVMGAFLIMTAPMLAACAYYTKRLWLKCVVWGITGLLCIATLFTFSRGAWFGLTIAVVVFSLLVDRKLLFVALAGIIGIIFCVPEIANRIQFLFTPEFEAANNSGGRGERWKVGLDLWRRNKTFGFGLGRFGGAIAMQNQEVEGLEYFYMDNYYLKTLTEMGLFGIISYVWLLFRNIIWSLRSLFRARENRLSYLACGIFAGQIGVLAHSYFENIFEVPYMNAYFWGLSAAVIYLGFLRRDKAEENEKDNNPEEV